MAKLAKIMPKSVPTISLVPMINLDSHQNIRLHNGARVNFVLLT